MASGIAAGDFCLMRESSSASFRQNSFLCRSRADELTLLIYSVGRERSGSGVGSMSKLERRFCVWLPEGGEAYFEAVNDESILLVAVSSQ